MTSKNKMNLNTIYENARQFKNELLSNSIVKQDESYDSQIDVLLKNIDNNASSNTESKVGDKSIVRTNDDVSTMIVTLIDGLNIDNGFKTTIITELLDKIYIEKRLTKDTVDVIKELVYSISYIVNENNENQKEELNAFKTTTEKELVQIKDLMHSIVVDNNTTIDNFKNAINTINTYNKEHNDKINVQDDKMQELANKNADLENEIEKIHETLQNVQTQYVNLPTNDLINTLLNHLSPENHANKSIDILEKQYDLLNDTLNHLISKLPLQNTNVSTPPSPQAVTVNINNEIDELKNFKDAIPTISTELNKIIDLVSQIDKNNQANNAATLTKIDANNAATLEQIDANNAATLEQIDANNAATLEQIDANNAAILAQISTLTTSITSKTQTDFDAFKTSIKDIIKNFNNTTQKEITNNTKEIKNLSTEISTALTLQLTKIDENNENLIKAYINKKDENLIKVKDQLIKINKKILEDIRFLKTGITDIKGNTSAIKKNITDINTKTDALTKEAIAISTGITDLTALVNTLTSNESTSSKDTKTTLSSIQQEIQNLTTSVAAITNTAATISQNASSASTVVQNITSQITNTKKLTHYLINTLTSPLTIKELSVLDVPEIYYLNYSRNMTRTGLPGSLTLATITQPDIEQIIKVEYKKNHLNFVFVSDLNNNEALIEVLSF